MPCTVRDTPYLATLGGGCFWCLEAVFKPVAGVVRVVPGYSGGHVPNPTHEQVTAGTTGHAEVVQVTFDPGTISYRELLEIFFATHDPTTLNRQGADVGPQYRSIIFHHSAEQRAIAEGLIGELEASGAYERPIVTDVVPFGAFYPAEQHHHDYYARNPGDTYCRLVIAPKLEALKDRFAHKLAT